MPDKSWFSRSKTCQLEGLLVEGRTKSGSTGRGRCSQCWRDGFGTLFARVQSGDGLLDVYASTCKYLPEEAKEKDRVNKVLEYNFAGRRYEGRMIGHGVHTVDVEHKDPVTGQKSSVHLPMSHILKS